MNESTPFADCEHIELHRLEPAFVDRRIQAPQSVRQLMLSIDRDGQRAPLIALDAGGPLVLIDGYRRWEALQRLGRDTGLLERWRCSLAEALAQVLLRHQGRTFEPIEQAWLLAAAQDEGMTQRDLAGALGKDPSWVTRRLALLRELSEPFQQAVRQGVLSSWAASRILVPLARANPADAERLLVQLRREPLSTRELSTWLKCYRRSNTPGRERLLEHPRLLIQAVDDRTAGQQDQPPEARWLQELAQLRRRLDALAHRLPSLLEPSPPPATWRALREAVAKTANRLEALGEPLKESDHALRSAARDDPPAPSQGLEHSPDRPHARPLPEHRAPGAQTRPESSWR